MVLPAADLVDVDVVKGCGGVAVVYSYFLFWLFGVFVDRVFWHSGVSIDLWASLFCCQEAISEGGDVGCFRGVGWFNGHFFI